MKCESKTRDIVVQKIETVKDGVVLTLNEDEAKALFSIVGSISGAGPIREVTSLIYNELFKHFGGHKVPKNPFAATPTLNGHDPVLKDL